MKQMTKKILSLVVAVCLILAVLPTAVEAATFKRTKDQLKSDISKYSVAVSINNSSQRFSIKKNEITSLSVKSKKYNSNKTKMTVKAVVKIDREVASVKGNATMVYKYNKSSKKWKLQNVSYTNAYIAEFSPIGVWSGTYTARQGETKIDVEIPDATDDGFFIDAIINFSALPTNPSVPSGSYSVIGGYDLSTGAVNFTGNKWIQQPDSGWSMINFNAYIDLVNKQITGTNNSLVLKKQV